MFCVSIKSEANGHQKPPIREEIGTGVSSSGLHITRYGTTTPSRGSKPSHSPAAHHCIRVPEIRDFPWLSRPSSWDD